MPVPVDSYTKEVGAEICRLISCGKSLVQACNGEGMPSRDTFYTWLHKHPELREMYDAANLLGADSMIDDCVDISDDVSHDLKDISGPNDTMPKFVVDNEAIQRSRLRIDTRFKIAARRNPKKWGDSVSLGAEDGKGGGFVIKISSVLSEEQA